jgi:hypothetical protein
VAGYCSLAEPSAADGIGEELRVARGIDCPGDTVCWQAVSSTLVAGLLRNTGNGTPRRAGGCCYRDGRPVTYWRCDGKV